MDSCQRRSVAEHLAGDMCARRHSGAHSEGAGSLLLEQSDRDSLQLSTQSTSLPLSFTDTSPDAGWVTTLANRFDLSTSIDAASLMARYDVFSTASSNTSILYALNALTPDLLDLENENENEQVSLTGSAEQNSYMTDLDICGLTDTLSHGTLADQARCKDPYQDMLSVNWDRGSKPFNLPSPALSRQSPSADSSVGSDGLESFGSA